MSSKQRGQLRATRISTLDFAWLLLESRETPMHVGALLEFSPPEGVSAPDLIQRWHDRVRELQPQRPPWNLIPVHKPLVGARLPRMRECANVDLDHHVRRWALPQPASQRELGVMVSWLHSQPLDLHRPMWETHVIEGLDNNRFAMYIKIHHSLIDGVTGMRLVGTALSTDPAERETPPLWMVAPSGKGAHRERVNDGWLHRSYAQGAGMARTLRGLGRAMAELRSGTIDGLPLRAPFGVPQSPLGGRIGGQRRFATQQYDFAHIKRLARAADCTVNDIVLYLCGTALRNYIAEYGVLPERGLTAGIPVSLREEGDERIGTAIGTLVAELGTQIADPLERLATIKASTSAAKRHLRSLDPGTLAVQTVIVNGPYIAALLAGMREGAPIPFSVGISNVAGAPELRYLDGARLDGFYPVSLLLHGNALNITCVSYAGTLNFGFVGARDSLPHLQRLAVRMGEAVKELSALLANEGEIERCGGTTS